MLRMIKILFLCLNFTQPAEILKNYIFTVEKSDKNYIKHSLNLKLSILDEMEKIFREELLPSINRIELNYDKDNKIFNNYSNEEFALHAKDFVLQIKNLSQFLKKSTFLLDWLEKVLKKIKALIKRKNIFFKRRLLVILNSLEEIYSQIMTLDYNSKYIQKENKSIQIIIVHRFQGIVFLCQLNKLKSNLEIFYSELKRLTIFLHKIFKIYLKAEDKYNRDCNDFIYKLIAQEYKYIHKKEKQNTFLRFKRLLYKREKNFTKNLKILCSLGKINKLKFFAKDFEKVSEKIFNKNKKTKEKIYSEEYLLEKILMDIRVDDQMILLNNLNFKKYFVKHLNFDLKFLDKTNTDFSNVITYLEEGTLDNEVSILNDQAKNEFNKAILEFFNVNFNIYISCVSFLLNVYVQRNTFQKFFEYLLQNSSDSLEKENISNLKEKISKLVIRNTESKKLIFAINNFYKANKNIICCNVRELILNINNENKKFNNKK
ncbi:hypothetical protein H311_01120 [Anncaliia algerae PRA109]|nr:hypothetical protein H311_01120 [Anncaliia algerae PRA109]